MSLSLIAENFHRELSRRLGTFNGSARIRNETKSVMLFGYTEEKKAEKFFKAMNNRTGIFSSTEVQARSIENGDLIFDRHDNFYGYITALQNKDYAYTAVIYVCNAQITIAHPTPTKDDFKNSSIDWTTTVHHTDLRALISLENYLSTEDVKGSKLDRTRYYCHVPFSATVHQGDRVFDGTRYYMVQNIDEISFNGALKVVEMAVANA